jgi:spore coat polysaccharide biosynthesis protein SpsF
MRELMIPALITVRSASSRLPGKCFLPFGDMSVLEHVVRRAWHYGLDPIVCTTNDPVDETIVELATRCNVKYFRGPTVNKLLRWSLCCDHFGLSSFHSVDADDPFFCGEEVHRSYTLLQTGFDMVEPSPSSSAGGATVGYSLTADVVKRASDGTADDLDTEMMWSYVDRLPRINKTILNDPVDHIIRARMTLDYPEDYILLEAVRLLVGNFATREEIYALFLNNPDIHRVNEFRTEEWIKNQKDKSI